MYHPDRVNDWLKNKPIFPVYMEVSPAGSCNHRCLYCALDFMEYQPRFLETSVFKIRLKEMGQRGLKSIMFAGEGEPFLHKDISAIIATAKRSGIDTAVTSNAVMYNQELVDRTLPYLTWIKVSINAARPKTYAKIHRANPADFSKVFKNMAYAVKERRRHGYKCTLGMQIILLPDNYREIELLAKMARSIGMDYLVVKPYSQHPQSKTKLFKDIKYNKYIDLSEKLKIFKNDNFNIIFRINTMQKWDQAKRNYKHCLGLPFWAYIDAGGNVWACSMYLNQPKFSLGNIYKKSFTEIWLGAKHKKLIYWAANKLNTDKCRVNCRMDEINRYLWELKNPSPHVNFI